MAQPSVGGLSETSGDNADTVCAQRIENREQTVPDHAEQSVTLFSVPLATIIPIDSEHIIECQAGVIEAHAVGDDVSGSLSVIPLELNVAHGSTA
jgi:hypothetical protein